MNWFLSNLLARTASALHRVELWATGQVKQMQKATALPSSSCFGQSHQHLLCCPGRSALTLHGWIYASNQCYTKGRKTLQNRGLSL